MVFPRLSNLLVALFFVSFASSVWVGLGWVGLGRSAWGDWRRGMEEGGCADDRRGVDKTDWSVLIFLLSWQLLDMQGPLTTMKRIM